VRGRDAKRGGGASRKNTAQKIHTKKNRRTKGKEKKGGRGERKTIELHSSGKGDGPGLKKRSFITYGNVWRITRKKMGSTGKANKEKKRNPRLVQNSGAEAGESPRT